MRKMISMAAVLIGMLFVFSQGALAQACDPKDPKCVPPKDGLDCSPGYWKNHTNVWFGRCCVVGPDCDGLLADLNLKGNDPAREAADADLTACFGDSQPCTDE